jgi:CPA2 family monovalent cation:H+ antiporter-2
MSELVFLRDFVVIFGVAIGVVFLFHRLHMASIVGYLIAGVLLGPSMFGVVGDVELIEVLAEFGVILLLFSLGIEFSLEELLKVRRVVFLGGSLQVLLTFLAVMLGTLFLGATVREGIFFGFLVSLSSTVIVLKVLSERAEVDAPQGRISVALLIFQDLSVVLMMLLVPLLSTAHETSGLELALTLFKALSLVGVIILAARVAVPRLLYHVVQTRSRELFLISVVLICFGTAWITSLAGLSLALGAFLAGLVISESEYGYQAFSEILPLRDLFNILFFVSIGMLLNVHAVLQQFPLIISAVLAILFIKFATSTLTTIALGYPLRIAVLVGVALAQIGEFSFVLSKTGLSYNLISDGEYQVFLATAIITMMLTPVMIQKSNRLSELVEKLPAPEKFKRIREVREDTFKEKENHVIIIGFGLNGRNLSKVLSATHIPFTVIEMNPETVRIEKKQGTPILYGDATQEAVLKHANIEKAHTVVIAIPDAAATRRIVELARRINLTAYIIARTRYISEVKPLYKLGADDVIPEEFETSIEIFSRVLQRYFIPRDEIEKHINEVRKDGYEMLRSSQQKQAPLIHLPELEIEAIRIHEDSPLAGHTLSEIELRKKYGVTVLAIQRSDKTITNPTADTQIQAQDIIILIGSRENITKITTTTQPLQP